MFKIIVFLLPVFFLTSCSCNSQNKPLDYNKAHINNHLTEPFILDDIKILSVKQKDSLTKKLVKYHNESGVTILCKITETVSPFNSDLQYSDIILDSYSKYFDSMIVVIVFTKDKKVFIRTDENSSKIISNLECKKIIDNSMAPYLRKGEYFKGLESAVDQLIINNRG